MDEQKDEGGGGKGKWDNSLMCIPSWRQAAATAHNVAGGLAETITNFVNSHPDYTTTMDRTSRQGVLIGYKYKVVLKNPAEASIIGMGLGTVIGAAFGHFNEVAGHSLSHHIRARLVTFWMSTK